MQQPNVRLRCHPHRCSQPVRQRHLWEAALCLLLLCQLPAEAARSASAHRLARQRALKASQAASSDGSSQLRPGLSSQGLDRSTSQGLDRSSSSHAARPSSLVSTSDTTVVNPGVLPTASNQASSKLLTSELDAAVKQEPRTPKTLAQLPSERTPSGSSITDSGAASLGSSSSSSSNTMSKNASAHVAPPPPSRNVNSQAEPKLVGSAAAFPPVMGTSEAAWLNVSLEFPSNAKAPHNYAEALHKSLLFYWAQRSGPMPVKRLAWRSDSCLECVGAHGEVSLCLSCVCSLLLYTNVPALTLALGMLMCCTIITSAASSA